MNGESQTRPAHTYADPTPTGHILLVTFDTVTMSSHVVRFTPGEAARLGHRLISLAQLMEDP